MDLKRDKYLNDLINRMHNGMIKVVTGIRRLDYIESRIADKEQYYILIDEVQLLEEFEEVLNSLLHIKKADVYQAFPRDVFKRHYRETSY